MLEDMGIHTGVNLPKLLQAAHYLEQSLGRELPGQVLKSGPIRALHEHACGGIA